jgi:hypothetical protein
MNLINFSTKDELLDSTNQMEATPEDILRLNGTVDGIKTPGFNVLNTVDSYNRVGQIKGFDSALKSFRNKTPSSGFFPA